MLKRFALVLPGRRVQDGVASSPRALAVKQLIRIEFDEAYAGRVGGKIRAPAAGKHTRDEARRVPR